MKAIVCEMCSGNDFAKVDGMFVCQNCGTKYSPEEAKKMMIEGTVDVRVDRGDEAKKYFELARRAFDSSDYDSAGRYYQQVLEIMPDSWEASFYSVLCRAACCKIRDIASSCKLVGNSLSNVFTLIKENTEGAEQVNAVSRVAQSAVIFAESMFDAAQNHYYDIDLNIRSRYKNELSSRVVAAINVMIVAGNCIRNTFGGMPVEKACLFGYKKAAECALRSYSVQINLPLETMLAAFDKFDPDYASEYRTKLEKQKNNLSGCIWGFTITFVIGMIILWICFM